MQRGQFLVVSLVVWLVFFISFPPLLLYYVYYKGYRYKLSSVLYTNPQNSLILDDAKKQRPRQVPNPPGPLQGGERDGVVLGLGVVFQVMDHLPL